MGNDEGEAVGLVGNPDLSPPDDHFSNDIIFNCKSYDHPGEYEVTSFRAGHITERASSGLPPCTHNWLALIDHTHIPSFF